MDHSPKGRDIAPLHGDAGTIVSRGNEVTTLGEQMVSSAAMLKDIADGASGQKGLAVEKLQEVVGDCYEELKLAGERYKPTGPVLVTYGNVVAEVQPLIKTAVQNCEADWNTYQSKRGAIWDAQTAHYPGSPLIDDPSVPDPADARKEAVADAQGLADSAYGDWESEARIFDTHYDTWEAAFDKAAEDIGDATEGGIQDSKWDDLDGFVAGALEVLKWVGLALAVLGVIIGGPFIAALAAIVAIATLLLTLYSFSRGNSSVLDLVLAVVGVIPFGSLGKLFNGNKLGFADDMLGGLLTSGGRANIVGDLRAMGSGFNAGFAFASGGNVSKFFSGLNGGRANWMSRAGDGFDNIMSRFMTGSSADALADPNFIGSAIDGMDGLSIFSGTLVTHLGRIDQITGISGMIDSPSLSEPLWGTPTR